MPSRTRRPGLPTPGAGDTLTPEASGEDVSPFLRDPEDAEWLAFPTATAGEDEPPRRARSLPPMPFAGASSRLSSSLSSSLSGLMDSVLSRGDFRWSERNHRDSALRRQVRLLPAFGLAALVVVAAGTFAWVLASRAASQATVTQQPKAQATAAAPGGLILQAPGSATPTPQAAHYLIGAWLSQTSPGGGATQIFVRVSHDNAPVAGVPVTITLSLGDRGGTDYGPVPTDGYGLATFNVFLGVGAGTPGYLEAHATVNGQALSFNESFVTSAYYAPPPPPEPTQAAPEPTQPPQGPAATPPVP